MLTFFRKIRKSLIDSSSARKYALYAIGEIALVVIGILIALQINNWNEWRKDRVKEKEILGRIQTDLLRDSNMIVFVIEQWDKKKSHLRLMRYHIDNGFVISTDSIKATFDSSAHFSLDLPTLPQNETFQELISTGQLSLIRNVQLRNQIVVHYSTFEKAMERLENRRSKYQIIAYQLLDKEGFFLSSPLHQGHSFKSVLSTFNLEKQLVLEYMQEVNYAGQVEYLLNALMNDNIDLLRLIKQELGEL